MSSVVWFLFSGWSCLFWLFCRGGSVGVGVDSGVVWCVVVAWLVRLGCVFGYVCVWSGGQIPKIKSLLLCRLAFV